MLGPFGVSGLKLIGMGETLFYGTRIESIWLRVQWVAGLEVIAGLKLLQEWLRGFRGLRERLGLKG